MILLGWGARCSAGSKRKHVGALPGIVSRRLTVRIVCLAQREEGSGAVGTPVTCDNTILKPKNRFWLIKAEKDY